MRAVGMRMMSQPVHVLTQHLGRFKAQHLRTRPIDKYAVAFEINAENALTRGLQKQPELVWPGERLRAAYRLRRGRNFSGGRLHSAHFSKH